MTTLHRNRLYYFGLTLIMLHTRIKEVFTEASSSNPATPFTYNVLPYFDFDVQRNLTVTVGQTGFLHCRVERLGDKDVSWIRKRDLHILTAGVTVYTSDQRFQVTRPKNSTNWTLQIKYPQLRDAGVYECQINTEPKLSLSYEFNVVELKANILGPTDLYVKSGSDINLTCNISQGPHELGNIFWYKGGEIVDTVSQENEIYSEGSKRITVDTDWADGLISRLKIRKATPNDSGNYSCVPTIAKPSSAYVHVIIGEHPAAMQHNAAVSCCSVSSTVIASCLALVVSVWWLSSWRTLSGGEAATAVASEVEVGEAEQVDGDGTTGGPWWLVATPLTSRCLARVLCIMCASSWSSAGIYQRRWLNGERSDVVHPETSPAAETKKTTTTVTPATPSTTMTTTSPALTMLMVAQPQPSRTPTTTR